MTRVRKFLPNPSYRFAFTQLLRCFRDHSFSFGGKVSVYVHFRGAFTDKMLKLEIVFI